MLSLLLALMSVATTSACAFLEEITSGLDGFLSVTDESETLSHANEDAESEESELIDSASEEFIPEQPDADKLILREETDEIGHKIVYYTDGTFEDLGRVEAIDFSALPLEEQYAYSTLKRRRRGTPFALSTPICMRRRSAFITATATSRPIGTATISSRSWTIPNGA